MKYIIEFEDEPSMYEAGFKYYQCKQVPYWSVSHGIIKNLTPYTEPNEDESYGASRYKSIGLAFLKWLGSDTGDKLKSADDVYRFLDKNCYNKDAVEQQVWEFAGKMISTSGKEVSEMWGCATNFGEVMHNTTYSEAKAKYEEWKKQKDEIHVGDEIVGIYSDGEKSPPLVVLKVEGNYYYGIYSKTGEFVQGGLNYEKTGRHFDEVAELLEKMRGEEG